MRTDEIVIDEPCDVPWASMRGTDRKRFCDQCDKHVHDLSAMTREEAASVVQDGRCVQYRADADGNLLFRPSRKRDRLRRWMVGSLTAVGLASAPVFAAEPSDTPGQTDDSEAECGILPMAASASAGRSVTVAAASSSASSASADRSWLDRVWSWLAGDEEPPGEPTTSPPVTVDTGLVPTPPPTREPVVRGKMAFHPPKSQSPVQVTGAGQATQLEVRCPGSNFRARTAIQNGSGAIPRVPEGETCTAIVTGGPATFPVEAGQTCSPSAAGTWTCK